MNQLVGMRRLWTEGTVAGLLELYTGEIRRALNRSHGRAETDVAYPTITVRREFGSTGFVDPDAGADGE